MSAFGIVRRWVRAMRRRGTDGRMRRPRTGARLFRFGRDRRGATAVEFALIAPVFTTLLLGTFEASFMFFANNVLDGAIQDTARMIRTGQVQAAAMTAEQFRTQVCTRIEPVLACDARLRIDVDRFQNFQNVNFQAPLDANGNFTGQERFNPGGPGDVVLVRIHYLWDVMTPIAGEALANAGSERRLVSSAAAFRNEPFGSILQ